MNVFLFFHFVISLSPTGLPTTEPTTAAPTTAGPTTPGPTTERPEDPTTSSVRETTPETEAPTPGKTMHLCVPVWACLCACMFICMCMCFVCMCVGGCVYLYIHVCGHNLSSLHETLKSICQTTSFFEKKKGGVGTMFEAQLFIRILFLMKSLARNAVPIPYFFTLGLLIIPHALMDLFHCTL